MIEERNAVIDYLSREARHCRNKSANSYQDEIKAKWEALADVLEHSAYEIKNGLHRVSGRSFNI